MSARILVADDQASYREVIARLLRDAGYHVVLASSGDEAIELARKEQPHAALLDVVMPGTDGIDVVQALRRDAALPYIPVMFVSTRSEPADRVAGLRAGAEDYLAKPFDQDELLARVQVLVRLHHLITGLPEGASGRESAARDTLTGMWTHGYLDERLRNEVERANRHNEPLSLMMIDIDGASQTDPVGQSMIVAAGEAIARCVRTMDVVSRGGDAAAFAVILPKTHFAGAVATADRVWRELAATHVPDRSAGLRPSIGVACYPTRTVSDGASLHEYAVSALARARTEGPAHICLYQHQAYIFQPE